MMYYGLNGMWPFHIFGFGSIFMVIFWGLVIYGIYLLMGQASNKGDNAMNILKIRYAKGEITKEEFESMRKNIK
ncbi:SHOCT domain-containing protein [Candidatus Peribacteria bacterium]|nr:SHOCT domain-containing protein [Candidatus Peribacteria bacterium]